MKLLEHKRVVAADVPLSTKPSRETRYRIADPYMRFYLSFLQSATPLIERGRPNLALQQVRRSWTSWRGRAVEPVIREALFRLSPELGWPDVQAVGGWWNRQDNPEIDLVGADREPVARRIVFTGSVKWHDTRPFDRHDEAEHIRAASAVPGVDDETEMIAISRQGADQHVAMRTVTPADLIGAW